MVSLNSTERTKYSHAYIETSRSANLFSILSGMPQRGGSDKNHWTKRTNNGVGGDSGGSGT